MKRIAFFLLLLPAALFAQTPSLGKIGDLELKADEVREQLAGLEASRETPVSKDSASLNQYVRGLLLQKFLLQQATEQKFDQDPAVVARLVRARESALVEAYLESRSKPDAAFPSDAELITAYENAKPKLVVPKSYQISQIFISADKDGAQARVDALQKLLKTKNADFAQLAQSHSEEPNSAAKGGDLGWISESQIQPEIRSSIDKLQVGTTSAPIRLKDGWHWIKLADQREAYTPTLDQIRAPFIARLRAEKAQLNHQQFVAQLLKDHPLAINEIELSKIVPAN